MRTAILGALVGALLVFTLGMSWEVTILRAEAEAVTAQQPGDPQYVDSFVITCATTATKIVAPSSGKQYAYECTNSTTTKVYVGDNDIGTTDDTDPRYCKTNCASQIFGAPARFEYCRVASGTQTIACRATVRKEP